LSRHLRLGNNKLKIKEKYMDATHFRLLHFSCNESYKHGAWGLNKKYSHATGIPEQVEVAVLPWISIWEAQIQISARWPCIFSEVYPGCPHSLQVNARIQPHLGHNRLLPPPLQRIQ
jgi:hypothetical protein